MLLFWKQGFHHTSIQDLVDKLEINRGSLYDTFGGKQQLYNSAFALYRKINREGLAHFLGTQDDIRKGLKSVFQKIILDDANDEDCKGCFIVNTTTEMIPLDPDLQEIIKDHRLATQKIFADFLQKGISKGQVPPEKDVVILASLLYTFMSGLRVVGKTKQSREESFQSVEAFLTVLD